MRRKQDKLHGDTGIPDPPDGPVGYFRAGLLFAIRIELRTHAMWHGPAWSRAGNRSRDASTDAVDRCRQRVRTSFLTILSRSAWRQIDLFVRVWVETHAGVEAPLFLTRRPFLIFSQDRRDRRCISIFARSRGPVARTWWSRTTTMRTIVPRRHLSGTRRASRTREPLLHPDLVRTVVATVQTPIDLRVRALVTIAGLGDLHAVLAACGKQGEQPRDALGARVRRGAQRAAGECEGSGCWEGGDLVDRTVRRRAARVEGPWDHRTKGGLVEGVNGRRNPPDKKSQLGDRGGLVQQPPCGTAAWTTRRSHTGVVGCVQRERAHRRRPGERQPNDLKSTTERKEELHDSGERKTRNQKNVAIPQTRIARSANELAKETLLTSFPETRERTTTRDALFEHRSNSSSSYHACLNNDVDSSVTPPQNNFGEIRDTNPFSMRFSLPIVQGSTNDSFVHM